MAQLIIKNIPEDEKNRFKSECAKYHASMAEFLRWVIREVGDGKEFKPKKRQND